MPKPAVRIAAALACALLVSSQVSAADGTPGSHEAIEALAHGSGAALNSVAPWAGVLTYSTGRRGWSALNLYARRQNGAVRLYARYDHGPFLKAGARQFADDATCPGLKGVMSEAEHVDPPHLHNELLGGKPREIILDGVSYELWGNADGPMARTTIAETEGGPVSAYMERALSALQACWTSKPPS